MPYIRPYIFEFFRKFTNFDFTAEGRGRSFVDQPHATEEVKKFTDFFLETRTYIGAVR